jgi:SH3-like domain-containing protein
VSRIIFLAIILVFSSAVHALCVTSNGVSLRSGAGTNFPVTWVVPKYTPLIEIRKTGNWIEVEDMDGIHHWVAATSVTRKITCVSVRVNTAKLRKSAGASSDLADIRQVDKYTAFKRIDAQNDWYQVEASWGETYWVNETNVWRPVTVAKVKF